MSPGKYERPSSISPMERFIAFRQSIDESAFDGNDNACTGRWLLANANYTGLSASLIARLMAATLDDEMNWVVVPQQSGQS